MSLHEKLMYIYDSVWIMRKYTNLYLYKIEIIGNFKLSVDFFSRKTSRLFFSNLVA